MFCLYLNILPSNLHNCGHNDTQLIGDDDEACRLLMLQGKCDTE